MKSRRPAAPSCGKPGRESLVEWARLVDTCLKHLDDAWRLRDSPLAKIEAVRAAAEREFPGDLCGAVRVLQDLLCRAVDSALPLMPPPKREFLEQYARGEKIAAIARRMGMTRSNLSREFRPMATEAG